MRDRVSVFLPKDLYEKVRRHIKSFQREFSSVEQYIIFVLREAVKEEIESRQDYTSEEEEKIKERLKHLGYF